MGAQSAKRRLPARADLGSSCGEFLWDEYGGTAYAPLCKVELLDYDQQPADCRGPRPTHKPGCACTHCVSLAPPPGALLKAAGDGDVVAVARLLAAGADEYYRYYSDSAGRTALHLASVHGHLAVVEELLEAEAHRRRSKKAIIDHKKKYHWL
jgi:hypothetical protein